MNYNSSNSGGLSDVIANTTYVAQSELIRWMLFIVFISAICYFLFMFYSKLSEKNEL
jgi:hypothetical protein